MTNPLPASYTIGKATIILLKIRNKTGMSAFISLIQHRTGSLGHRNQTRRINKRHPNWKGRSKTVIICRWQDLYMENPRDSTKKLLQLINEFSKVAGYKISIQMSVASLYTNNELLGELRKQLHLHLLQRNKILRNKFNQEDKRLENCVTEERN